MDQILNNYTIDDFLKIKPIIYEYCINLTQVKTQTTWFKDKAEAEDLYQDVCVKVILFLNKDFKINDDNHFLQIVKNITYKTYVNRFRKSEYKLYKNTLKFEDVTIDYLIFNNLNFDLKIFENYKDNPDYILLTKNLNFTDKKYIDLIIQGYSINELCIKYKKTRTYFNNILKNVQINALNSEKPNVKIFEKVNNKVFLQKKINNFDKVFKNDKFIQLYALYLKGYTHKYIAKKLNKSSNQITVEIYRINQKIKKYESLSRT